MLYCQMRLQLKTTKRLYSSSNSAVLADISIHNLSLGMPFHFSATPRNDTKNNKTASPTRILFNILERHPKLYKTNDEGYNEMQVMQHKNETTKVFIRCKAIKRRKTNVQFTNSTFYTQHHSVTWQRNDDYKCNKMFPQIHLIPGEPLSISVWNQTIKNKNEFNTPALFAWAKVHFLVRFNIRDPKVPSSVSGTSSMVVFPEAVT